MDYMTGERLGFNKEQTVILERTDLLGENTRAFKNELANIRGVLSITGSTALPGQQNYFGVSWATVEKRNEPITGRGILVDEDYAEALGLELVAGRFFSRDFPTDSLGVVINEKAAAELGLADDPIGQRLITPDPFLNAPDGAQQTYHVIGVVKDFHYQSLHEPITPLVFTSGAPFNNVFNLTAIHVEAGAMERVLSDVERLWARFVPEKPLTFEFLDQTIANQYDSEATARKVFTFFSFITIFIACIGLLGLAAYTTRQRVHEIGVRKVLGASVGNIVLMLSRNFIKLVAVATLVAVPVAWYFMYRWLQNFTYRIDSSWDLFVWASAIALATAFLTISFQAIRAAVQNPVKSLRTE
jgi:putative ABC transport system permease protein